MVADYSIIMYKKLSIIMLVILFFTSVHAVEPKYNIVLKDNGESIVLVELREEGTYDFKVPSDSKIEAKGALYLKENNEISAYAGNKKKGVIAYSTNSYTVKIKDVWSFTIDFDEEIKDVTLILPKNAYIKSTIPNPIIKNNELYYKDVDSITVNYFYTTPESFSFSENMDLFIYSLLIIIAVIIGFVMIRYLRKPKDFTAKENILKTLPHNERKILRIMLDESGEMKRNKLEKISKISKSSLANSLNNLEKKNILEIDKTYVVHTVKISDWFKKL
jgi:uncharacterized membrane protein